MSFFGGTVRGETIKAAESTTLWELSREAFEAVLTTRPHVSIVALYLYYTMSPLVVDWLMNLAIIASITNCTCSSSAISAGMSTIL
jgi:hypothetical protein